MSQPSAQATGRAVDAPLPAHWGRWQRSKNTLIYYLVRALFWCFQLVPFPLARLAGRVLGHLAATFDLPDRRRAERQLAFALPDLSPAERRRVSRGMFVHLGLAAVEAAQMHKLTRGPKAQRIDAQSRALFDEALAEGKGVVAVSGHIGNWELLAQTLACEGLPVATIAKPIYDPRLTRWVDGLRSSSGLEVIWRGDRSGSRDMLRVFRSKGILALLIDQDTKVQGDFVPFFGKPAFTPTAAATLALRFDAPVIVGWTHRHGNDHRFTFRRVEKPDSGDRDADVLALTARLNEHLADAIGEAPEQWVWLHDRWKRQPQ